MAATPTLTKVQTLKLEIEQLHRAGRRALALQKIRQAIESRLPREELLPFASLARRAGAPQWGAKLLHTYVRPTGRQQIASPSERAEYAACLVRIGAEAEALKILEGIDGREFPQVLLFRAFALVPHWNYRASIPLLEEFIHHPRVPGEIQLVGVANLAAALIAEKRLPEAEKQIASLLARAKEQGLKLPYGIGLELSARAAVAGHDWKNAEKRIDEVLQHFGDNDDIHVFFARKWRCFFKLEKDPRKPEVARALEALRAEAVRREEWETVRECDRYEATATGDRRFFDRVFVGTPYPNYRESLLHDFKAQFAPPEFYDWRPGEAAKLPADGTARRHIDLRTGEADGGLELKPGQHYHRLLSVFSLDFYRPLRLASLHSLLFPDEFFNPVSSPNRVHNALFRFREWAEANRLPIEVEEKGGSYRLIAKSGLFLRCYPAGAAVDPQLERLRRNFGATPFTTQDAASVLALSRSATQRVLDDAVKGRSLAREGRGRASRLKFAA